jgi:hypothetical protein
MKRQQFFIKRLVSTLLVIFMLSIIKAEVPFSEAKGIYAATKDKYKHISPFRAMVSVYGRILERIRFLVFYVKKEVQNQRMQDMPMYEKDHIATSLLKSFSNSDGVQFVANTREGIIGRLSENLALINDTKGKANPKNTGTNEETLSMSIVGREDITKKRGRG